MYHITAQRLTYQHRFLVRRSGMQEFNGAEIIVDHLIGQKVPHLVGVCGHGNVGLMDAAYDRRDKISTISAHDEQTAGCMADAYYRVTGQPRATYTRLWALARSTYKRLSQAPNLTRQQFSPSPGTYRPSSSTKDLFRNSAIITRPILLLPCAHMSNAASKRHVQICCPI